MSHQNDGTSLLKLFIPDAYFRDTLFDNYFFLLKGNLFFYLLIKKAKAMREKS